PKIQIGSELVHMLFYFNDAIWSEEARNENGVASNLAQRLAENSHGNSYAGPIRKPSGKGRYSPPVSSRRNQGERLCATTYVFALPRCSSFHSLRRCRRSRPRRARLSESVSLAEQIAPSRTR